MDPNAGTADFALVVGNPQQQAAQRGAHPDVWYDGAQSAFLGVLKKAAQLTGIAIGNGPVVYRSLYGNMARIGFRGLFITSPIILDTPVVNHCILPQRVADAMGQLITDGLLDGTVELETSEAMKAVERAASQLDITNLPAAYVVTVADLSKREAVYLSPIVTVAEIAATELLQAITYRDVCVRVGTNALGVEYWQLDIGGWLECALSGCFSGKSGNSGKW
jgi:hypothetical protein